MRTLQLVIKKMIKLKSYTTEKIFPSLGYILDWGFVAFLDTGFFYNMRGNCRKYKQ